MPIYTYITLDDPSANEGTTFARALNDMGQVVGDYVNASHGFLYSPNGNSYASIDDPAATHPTVAFGINDAGQIVGFYHDASDYHGFLLSSSIYTPLDDLSANFGTFPTGINTIATGCWANDPLIWLLSSAQTTEAPPKKSTAARGSSGLMRHVRLLI
jgi:hypothetical protein